MDLAKVFGHQASRVVLSPVGRLAVGSHTGAVTVWKMATGEEVLRLDPRAAEYGSEVRSFGRRPGRPAAGTRDGGRRLRLWDCGSGKGLFRLPCGPRREGAGSGIRPRRERPGLRRGCLLHHRPVVGRDWAARGAEKGEAKLGTKELEERWRLLAGADAVAAHRRGRRDGRGTKRAVPSSASG